MKRRVIRKKRFRIIVEPNWRNRSRPYWFNVKYPNDMRRICVPLLTIDLFAK